MPFGFLSFGFSGVPVFTTFSRLQSPMPFGFLSFGFNPYAMWRETGQVMSPMPFGFLSFGFTNDLADYNANEAGLQCLSAFCPLASSVPSFSLFRGVGVSNAFRLSVLWLPEEVDHKECGRIVSPMPFGFLSFGFKENPDQCRDLFTQSPMPFGFLSFGFITKTTQAFDLALVSPMPFGFLSFGFSATSSKPSRL